MTFSRWGRFLPAVRDDLQNASRSSALRPWGGSSAAHDPVSSAFKFFANEMRTMEREMSRMENDFFRGANRDGFFRPFSSLFNNNSNNSNDALSQRGSNWDDYIVEGKDGKQKLQMEFDASGFKPEDIHISTRGKNRIEINAKYQDESEGHRVYQEYNKMMSLPEGVDVKQLSCHFENNALVIEAPYTPPKNVEQLGSSASATKGPHKINVKHLGEDDGTATHGGDVEGGSQPMVGGGSKTQESWPPKGQTLSASTGSGGSGTSHSNNYGTQSTKSEQPQKKTAQGGRSY